jgi:hypothetical protein
MIKKRLSPSAVLAVVLALVVIAPLFTGCASSANSYASATVAYNAESAQYAADRATVDTSYAAGKVTAAQYDQYVAIQQAYKAADTALYADLRTWQSSNAQPATYTANATARSAAATQMSTFAKGIH